MSSNSGSVTILSKRGLDSQYRQEVFRFLSEEAYWSKGIPEATFNRSVENSLCFVILVDNQFAGFARVISDFATVAYLGDVFVLPEFRGQGLAKRLVTEIHQHPDLQGLRRWILLTADAHSLYQGVGWSPIANPARWMEIANSNVYSG